MRQNNQNKRLRGRGRKGPNPLTRSFESNGPDVKIRGTAMHIAEKYQQLARDAMVSGDRIMAENYLQHAEHYSRIVAAAQAQTNTPVTQSRSFNDDDDEDADEQTVETPPVAAKPRVMPEDAPQPFVDRMPGIDAKNGGTSEERSARAEANGEAKDEEKPTEKAPARAARSPRCTSSKAAAAKNAAKAPEKDAGNADAAAAGNGSGENGGSGDNGSGEEGEEPARPRRRARGARGRNVRRPSANAGDQDAGSGENAATEATEA